jgi:hypothetical protein
LGKIDANQPRKPNKIKIVYKLPTREDRPDDEVWAEMLKNQAPLTFSKPEPKAPRLAKKKQPNGSKFEKEKQDTRGIPAEALAAIEQPVAWP